MARKWQEIRVFISSTFRDMHAERDHLIKVVFPELRERLEKHRFHLVDIDLRWGVTAEQAENVQVLDLCLDEIDRYGPFFVGILGQRYGWVLEDFPDPAVKKYGWIQGMPCKSITELEILHGVILNTAMTQNAMFYFRQDDFLKNVPQDVRNAIYTDEYGDKLDIVKSDIERFCSQHNAPLRDYPCAWESKEPDPENGIEGRIIELEQFGEWVRDDLWNAIAREHPEIMEKPSEPGKPGTEDWLAEEQDYHERFIESRLRVYVDRQRIQDQLIDYLESDSIHPLLLVGGSGSGKSTILGKLWENWCTQNPNTFIIPHFVGASGASTNHHSMLLRFCLELRAKFNITETVEEEGSEPELRPKAVPDDPQKFLGAFSEFLEAVPTDQRVVFLIDAVNQLDEMGGAQEMNWLPYVLPSNVKIVVSCIEESEREEPALNALRRCKVPELCVEPLTDDERIKIITQVSSISAKSLGSEQIALLLKNPATKNPLYLTVALEELRGFGSFEQLDSRIQSFPSVVGAEGVIGLFIQVIERLEHEINVDTVKAVLSLIATSRSGLSERELAELLNNVVDHECEGELQIILRQIRPYLLCRRELIDFYHRSFYKSTAARYLHPEEFKNECQQALADFFRQEADPEGDRSWSGESRALSELPFHSTEAEDWAGLIGDEVTPGILTDLRFIQAKCEAGFVYELVTDYNNALVALPEFAEEKKRLVRRDEAMLNYHAMLKEYGCLWWDYVDRKDKGHAGEEPKRPSLPIELRAETAQEIRSLRAARLHLFASFVAGHTAFLASHPIETLPLAYNEADGGPVSSFAERGLEVCDRPWLRRHLRPPASTHPSSCIRVFEGHRGMVSHVSLTPDGRRAVSASEDNTLRIWDLDSGQCIRTLEGHRGGIYNVSLTPDGRRAVSASDDGTLRIWNLDTGQCLHTLAGHSLRICHVSLTLDGRKAVSASEDKTLRIWDVETGKCLYTLEGHRDGVCHVSLSPDGSRAVSGCEDGTFSIWDMDTGECLHSLAGRCSLVRHISITPDGRRAVTAIFGGHLMIWDLDTGECLRSISGHMDGIDHVSITPDGRRAVSSSDDGTLRIWDLDTGECLHTLAGHGSGVNYISLTPDGRRAVSASSDRTLRIWDLDSGECLHTLAGHSGDVLYVSLTRDGRRAVSASSDRTLRIWNMDSGDGLSSPVGRSEKLRHVNSGWGIPTFRGNSGGVCQIDLTYDGRRAVSSSSDGSIRIWNMDTGECLSPLVGRYDNIRYVSITPDGKRVVSVSSNETLKIWDLDTGECLHLLPGHIYSVYHISLTPDGRMAVSSSYHGTLRIWDLNSGKCLRTFEGHSFDVKSILITPDGRRAVTSISDNTLKIWDLDTGECLHTLSGDGIWITSVLISPDGRKVVSSSSDGSIRIWDLESGECLPSLAGHGGWGGDHFLLTPDGRRAITDISVKTIVIWDLDTGECLHTLTGHSHHITSVRITSDGRRAVSASIDNTLRIWDLESGECLHVLTGHSAAVNHVSLTLDGRIGVSVSNDMTLRVWNLDSGECIIVYYLGSIGLSTAISGDLIACGTAYGQVYLFTGVNFPRPGSNILTIHRFVRRGGFLWRDQHLSHCPRCARAFSPPRKVVRIVRGYSAIPIPQSAFDDPLLLADCPNCGKPLKFNPFFVEMGVKS